MDKKRTYTKGQCRLCGKPTHRYSSRWCRACFASSKGAHAVRAFDADPERQRRIRLYEGRAKVVLPLFE